MHNPISPTFTTHPNYFEETTNKTVEESKSEVINSDLIAIYLLQANILEVALIYALNLL